MQERALEAVKLDVSDEKLKQEKELLRYPTASRRASSLTKALWGILLGAGIVVGGAVAISAAHLWLVGAVVLGVAFIGGKTIRDIYVRNKQEQALTQKINEDTDTTIEEMAKMDMDPLKSLVTLLETNPELFDSREKEKIYARLVDLKTSTALIKPKAAAKYVVTKDRKYFDAIEKIKKNEFVVDSLLQKLNQKRDFPGAPLKEAYTHVPEPGKAPAKKPIGFGEYLWKRTKQLGNRVASFLPGFFGGMGLGVGIMTFAVGAVATTALLSNPIGWGFLGLIAGAALIGFASVAVDYYMSRSQTKKMDRLTAGIHEIHVCKKGVGHAAKDITDMLVFKSTHVIDATAAKNASLELEAMKKQNAHLQAMNNQLQRQVGELQETIKLKELPEQLAPHLRDRASSVSAGPSLFHKEEDRSRPRSASEAPKPTDAEKNHSNPSNGNK